MDRDNRGEQVVALKYTKENGVPKVVAKGSGYIAEQILDVAAQNDILVHTDKMLAENLIRLKLGENIPEEMFEIVAKIYAFIDRIDIVMGEAAE